MEPFLGMVALFGFNFAPRGWALCNGQLVGIAQNSALFALLGTTYGGDGQVTFGLPDLRGRIAVGQGFGPGLSGYQMGQMSGTEQVTLNVTQMPAHNHPIGIGTLTGVTNARDISANSQTPAAAMPAIEAAGVTATYSTNAAAPVVAMAPGSVTLAGAPTSGVVGNNLPVPIVQPYTTFNYCIALEGIFPSRN